MSFHSIFIDHETIRYKVKLDCLIVTVLMTRIPSAANNSARVVWKTKLFDFKISVWNVPWSWPRRSTSNKFFIDTTSNKFLVDATSNKFLVDTTSNKFLVDTTSNKFLIDTISNKRLIDTTFISRVPVRANSCWEKSADHRRSRQSRGYADLERKWQYSRKNTVEGQDTRKRRACQTNKTRGGIAICVFWRLDIIVSMFYCVLLLLFICFSIF